MRMVGKSFLKLVFVSLSMTTILTSATSCRHRRSRSNIERAERRSDLSTDSRMERRSSDHGKSSIVPLEKGDGVYYLTAKINDVPMKFVFDTGASSISMSQTEAAFLYKQGTLTESDFEGVVNFQDARGDVSQGMVVKLRKVEIGNRVLHNVEASIVPNQNAPLLLGQTVLQKFGRFSIDNRNHQLILE